MSICPIATSQPQRRLTPHAIANTPHSHSHYPLHSLVFGIGGRAVGLRVLLYIRTTGHAGGGEGGGAGGGWEQASARRRS